MFLIRCKNKHNATIMYHILPKSRKYILLHCNMVVKPFVWCQLLSKYGVKVTNRYYYRIKSYELFNVSLILISICYLYRSSE